MGKDQDKDGWTPLHMAAENSHMEMVKFLAEKGAKIDAADKDYRTPLYWAALSGHIEVVKFLAEKGAKIDAANKDGWIPLQEAAYKGHIEVVKFLAEKGAKIDAANKDGWIPLHMAALKGHIEVVKFLVEKGAKIDAADNDGLTPLHMAALKGHMEVVKFLVEKGAKIDAANKYGRAPLYNAAYKGQIEVVKFLAEKGAKIDAVNKDGNTPLYMAALKGHIEVVKFLLKNGANVSGVEVKEKILSLKDFSFIPLFFVRREYESALKIVDELLQDSKEIIPLHLARAKILALQEPEKNSKQVIEIYNAIHKLEPNNYEVLRLLVIYQCRTQEEGTKFIQGIKDHLSANPGDVDLLHQQAMFHLLEEDERSLKKALSICEILPISRAVQTIQAFSLLGLEHYADAQAKFSTLQFLYSDDKYVNFGLAESFRALKRYKEAESLYVKLESIMTSLDDLLASVYMSHAQLKQALGLSKEAEELLKKIDLNCLVSEGTKEEICDQQKVCRQEEEFRSHMVQLGVVSEYKMQEEELRVAIEKIFHTDRMREHFIKIRELQESTVRKIDAYGGNKVDLNLKYGITQESVLHILIAKGQESALEHDRIVECFVQHGCNADIANSEGLSALKKAVQLKQYRVAAILMNHQGRFRDQEEKHVILDKAAECGFTIKPEDFEQAFDWEQKKDGNNLLELAVHNDDLSFFKTLLPKYEKFLMKDTEIGALLHFIAEEKRLEIFEHAKAVLQARGIMPPPMHLFIQVDLEKKMGAILADIHWEITTQEAFYGVDPNKLNARGNTILYELIKHRHKNGIKTLLEIYQHKIDVNLIGRSDGFTSLHLAVCSNQIAVVERLIEEGASLKRYDKWGHSALDIAISSPVYDDEKVVREQIVTFLIQVLSAPHAGHEYDLFLHESMYRGQKDTVTRLISSFPRQLDWAGDLAELCPVDYAMGTLGPKELVETRRAFARPHSRDATQFDDFEGSKLLNALPEEDYNLESIVTKYSWMMLNEYLIKNPPTQDAIDKALLVAVKEGKFEHMQCLLSRPSVELLHVAAERGHAKILLELIKNAPPSFVIESIDGKTALDLAIKSRSKTCVQYLLHKGARATSVDVDEMTENLCKETAETSEDKSKALACLNAFGDDRDLTKHAHDLRYWYSITDGIRLLIDIRQKLLRYTGAANVGEEAMALRENVDGIFVSDPYYTTNFEGYLRDDVAKITDGWRVMPKLIIIPVLYGVHWRAIAVEIGYEARRTRVLRDDPYGQGKFVALSGEFLEAIRHNIELLMRKQLRDDSFVLDSIEQREKEQDQQGSGENSWDCGPIVFSNIRDYVRTRSVEDVQYTIPPSSQRSPDFMANARVGDAEVCRAISGIEATGSNLQDISDDIQQKRDGKLHDLMEVLEEETLKIAISGLDPRHVSLLFSILETNRYLTGENVGKSYNVEELKAAYQMVTTLSVDSMAGRGTNSHSVDSWWCEYSVEGMRTLLPLRMAGFGVQFVSPVVMLGNLIIFPSFPSDFSTLVVPVLYSGHWMGFILQKDLNSCKVTFIDPENQQMPEGLTGFLTKLHIPSLKFEQKLVQSQSSNNCGPEFIEDVAETVTGARSPEHLVPAAHSELLAKVLWMRENFRLIEPAVATVACCIGVILFQQTKGIVIQAGCAEMFLKALWEEVEKHIAEKHSILEDGQALDVASNVQTETESAVGFYKIMQQFIEDIHSAWSMSSWAPALLKAIENWLSWDRDETDENIARTFQFLEIANSIGGGEMPLPFGGGHGPPDDDNGGYGGGDGEDKDAGNKDSSGGGFIELAGNTTKIDGEHV